MHTIKFEKKNFLQIEQNVRKNHHEKTFETNSDEHRRMCVGVCADTLGIF